MYGDGARDLQDEFDSRRLADVLAAVTVHDALTDDDVELVAAQSTVWIATVDEAGWPDVSYKGGDVGFVRVVSPTELRIPSYDGNGMMRTLGNVVDTGRVALLFVDTQRPWRMRLHGTARVSTDADDVAVFPGAHAVIVVTVGRVFPNCGRYVHPPDGISEFVPDADGTAPIPDWKRIDGLTEALPERDRRRIERGE